MPATREKGRRADPKNLRFVLRRRYGRQSFTRFADLIEAKRWTTAPGAETVKLPERATVLRFCRGDTVRENTWGPLSDELGLPFFLLELGHTLSKSELDSARFKRRWSFCHPASYTGQVWVRVVPGFNTRRLPHDYIVRWGPWKYSNVLRFGRMESATLVHMKGDDGLSIPIMFYVSRPCYVEFGQGAPPGEFEQDINHGWVKVD